MRLIPSDPDLETIVSRIDSGDIDLQPNFQRGEVWGKIKKQRLIDSILRDWHVPPIHVIENPKSSRQEVLDGQQRLAAIRDFVEGAFTVDGNIEPFNDQIHSLSGKTYGQLPDAWRRRFNQFTIRIFRIVDYEAGEPAELFFRLNQPSSLTGAEQRNAFFGPVREQIKDLVTLLGAVDTRALGFSNSRMAYDDVLARTALAVERASLSEKITSADLTALYRKDQPLDHQTIRVIERALNEFVGAVNLPPLSLPKFNKATVFSWLMFLVRLNWSSWPNSPIDITMLAEFWTFFQRMREHGSNHSMPFSGPSSMLFSIYDDRSSSRVADVSSVILRDAVIWILFSEFASQKSLHLHSTLRLERLSAAFAGQNDFFIEEELARTLIEEGWGRLT